MTNPLTARVVHGDARLMRLLKIAETAAFRSGRPQIDWALVAHGRANEC